MKKSELKQIIKEEITKVLNESLDSSRYHWPIPNEWFKKYYTMDFYEDGPRIFQNNNGEFISFSDVVKHYESEEGPILDKM